MGRQIIKQPDGKYSVWSTVVDDFIITDATEQKLEDDFAQEAETEERNRVKRTIAQIKNGEKPYHQFTKTWDDCQRIIKEKDADPEEVDGGDLGFGEYG